MFILQDVNTGQIEDVPDDIAQERILQGAYVLGQRGPEIERAIVGPPETAMQSGRAPVAALRQTIAIESARQTYRRRLRG